MLFVKIFQSKESKVHDFRKLDINIDYFVDFAKSGQSATLTTARKIKVGEKVILLYQQQAVTYSVENLEHYWNDDDIQTVLLKRIIGE